MKAKLHYAKQYEIGTVDRRMAGSFVEHLNRCVYGGIYEPEHPTADAYGFREDVKKLIREAGITLLRYPGGNFVSGYNWKDGIGPRESRPVRWDPAWKCLETNAVGTDEFVRYAGEVGAEVMMSVNLGTGTPKEAAELVEYCNGDKGTYFSELRRSNGAKEPYGIRLWCVGNEMDGPWQIGELTAHDYAQKYLAAARMMRSVDPEIELVACGSCSSERAHESFGIWDRTVLEEAYEEIDYLSLHRYYGYDVVQELFYPRSESLQDAPWMAEDLEQMLQTVLAAIDYVKGIRHSGHEVKISFDELSILPRYMRHPSGAVYDVFSQYDAVLYGSLLCVLLNHADRVRIGCQALVVNENGMFSAMPMGGTVTQSIAYPFRDMADCVGGKVLRQSGVWPELMTEHFGSVPCASAACVYLEEAKEVRVLAANLSLEQELELSVVLDGFAEVVPLTHTELYHEKPHVCNDDTDPQRILPVTRPFESAKRIRLRPHSWNVLRFSVKVQKEEEAGL